jgi:hypothetical protein
LGYGEHEQRRGRAFHGITLWGMHMSVKRP